MSVGEWLNEIIQPEDGDERPPHADYDDGESGGEDFRYSDRRSETRSFRGSEWEHDREPRRPWRRESRFDDREAQRRIVRDRPRRGSRPRDFEPERDEPNLRDAEHDTLRIRNAARAAFRAREESRARQHARELARAEARRAAREAARLAARDEARAQRAQQQAHEAARARAEMGDVHARLDRLSQQIERLSRTDAPRLTGAPPAPYREGRPLHGRPARNYRPLPDDGTLTVDDAVAEIVERQRVLYGERLRREPHVTAPALAPEPLSFSDRAPRPLPEATPPPVAFGAKASQPIADAASGAEMPVRTAPLPGAAAPPAPPSIPAAAAIDIFKLEEQLREITAKIETLRPANDLDRVIGAFRNDLAEISRQITEALPRRALESLEIEVQALAQRIDHSRDNGVDAAALAGLERGLAEIRGALHGLTPAENLVGFDDAVRTLSQKVDMILAKEDPATLQQLETAIDALRSIVAHVASNDTLTKVAEDVRALAAKVDAIANSAASGHAVAALENRIDTLANALNASAEAGHAAPRELEKLLSGLIEKLEWVQLTHSDRAALGHLEDRIAQLIKRLDASDARLGNLAAVERGLADLLVHINEARAGGGAATPAAEAKPAIGVIQRDVADIKRSDRRTQDSLEAVHGTVEHMVDRLAMIENGMHEGGAGPAAAASPQGQAQGGSAEIKPAAAAPIPSALRTAAAPAAAVSPAALLAPEAGMSSASAEATARRAAAPRAPIDPNLPPDHPLEPGFAIGPRTTPSAADRIAASEAAAGHAKLAPASDSSEKKDFIAAARRAAQAAAAAPVDRKARAKTAPAAGAVGKPSRLRRLIVAAAAVVIAVVSAHIVLRMFQEPGTPVAPPPPPQYSSSTAPDKDQGALPAANPVLPAPSIPAAPSDPAAASAPNASEAPGQPLNIAPNVQPDLDPSAQPVPQRQSAQPDSSDVTGSLPRRVPPPPMSAAPSPASVQIPVAPIDAARLDADKLPAAIGGPSLRAAAMAGDVSAEYEVAMRFAAGRGAPQSNEQAAHWLERAAAQGSAPAQFRLGGLFEKGIGVKKDLAKARDLYAAAADKGNAKAMHNLAVLYAEGINGPADYRSAAHWFRKAADRGVPDSQYNLAILYARGIGVEQNYAESYKWFALAANHGDNEAAKKRDEIAAHLDQQSLAAAETAVQKWTAMPQPDDAVNVKAPPGGWDPQSPAKPKPRAAANKPMPAEPKPN
jgi:localization factor PodJL